MASNHRRRRRKSRAAPAPGPGGANSLFAFERLESRCLLVAELPLVVERPTVNLSAQEQLLVEQVNFARAHPVETAARLGIDLNAGLAGSQLITADPKAPLAIRQSLVAAAGLHAQDMLDRDILAHEIPDGSTASTPTSRARASGYSHPVGENIAVRSIAFDPTLEVRAAHDQLFASPGHRANILRSDYRDLGVGIRRGDFLFPSGSNLDSLMATELFGPGDSASITGVVFDDAMFDDDQYSAGEGLVGVVIQATASDGTVYRTHSGTSGGYSLDVPNGAYSLIVTGAGLPNAVTIAGVQVTGRNVKVDVTAPPPNLLVYDVSGDGQITPGDALLVLNYLNEGRGDFDQHRDVTRDGVIAPIDALIVINFMNVYGSGIVVPSLATSASEPPPPLSEALSAASSASATLSSAAKLADPVIIPDACEQDEQEHVAAAPAESYLLDELFE